MISRLALVILLLAPTLLLSQEDTKRPKNRLAGETSPYLRMHAHNPTDWYPWGPEAFEKAKKEKKLVFLSIGYSSCYWCHVMERESFNREDVAKILNDGFVCIKVDREERPDIDHVYMTAVQESTGGGGWPLNVFLLSDGRPITGGTYWPREDKTVNGKTYGGFMSLLKEVRKASIDAPDEIDKAATLVAAVTKKSLDAADAFKLAVTPIDQTLVSEAVEGLQSEFDPEYGGFGAKSRAFKGPKFPTTCRLQFLLSQAMNQDALKMATLTLDKMAAGGIYDHVGGGFHRYSTERTWTVPHFEKMLYDNAQLVEVYARAFALTGNPQYKRVVDQTLGYIQREMTLPDGSFASSQDAETEHEEGRFYVWTTRELSAALPSAETLEFARNVFGADGAPNFEKTAYVLTRPQATKSLAREMKLDEPALEAKIDGLRKTLYEARAKRLRPFRNDIALTAWSGLMIGAYASAGENLKNKDYVNTAIAAAEHVLKHQKTKDGRLLRTYGAAPGKQPAAAGPAYLDDYAFLVHGLLNLYDATKDKKWLDESAALTDAMIRWHGDEKRGGFYITANDHEKLFARAKDQFDGATPSGNSAAVRNLARLAKANDRFVADTEKHLKYFAGSLKSYPAGLSTMAEATHLYLTLEKK